MLRLKPRLIALAGILGCLVMMPASAGLLDRIPFPSVPNPLSQIQPPRLDETLLSEEQQRLLNGISYFNILRLNAAQLAAIPLGLIPEPSVSMTAEIGQLVADNRLKFTKAFLNAPPDVSVYTNVSDCSYAFTLSQAKADFSNELGLWPVIADDKLLLQDDIVSDKMWRRIFPNRPVPRLLSGITVIDDVPLEFDILGVPEVVHANTDVILSVNSPSAGIDRNGGTDDGYGPQSLDVPIGVHTIEWRAETQFRPIWDYYVPAAMIPIMMGVEAKFAPKIAQLKKWRGGALELSHTVGDPKRVEKLIRKLDRQIKFWDKVAPFLIEKVGVGSIEKLSEAIVDSVTTVQRSRNQMFTVYDSIAPSIFSTPAQLTFDATDIGGARTDRYIDEMTIAIVATDNCGREVQLFNDAPDFLPLGDTLVTWTARDLGPAPPELDGDGDGRLTSNVVQTITVVDISAPILVPPPSIVIESNDAEISLFDSNLGQPLVVDLADLYPEIDASTDGDGSVSSGMRAIVEWTATDASGNTTDPPGRQMVTLKAPGSNTPPVAEDKNRETLISQPVDIVLTGIDSDVLPFMNGDPPIADPLQFRIVDLPANGEFIAPLLPYFIDDYRTDKNGVLTPEQEIALAQAENQVTYLETEFCDKPLEYPDGIPVDFVLNPLFVQVTDEGESYYLDHYAVCDPGGQDDNPPVEDRLRISRWDEDRNLIGFLDYLPGGGGGFHTASFVIEDSHIYWLRGSDQFQTSVIVCDAEFSGNQATCLPAGIDPINLGNPGDGGISVGDIVQVALEVDSVTPSQPLVFVTDRDRVAVYEGMTFKGYLENNAGIADFLESPASCTVYHITDSSRQGFGIALDSEKNLYVADTCAHKIHKFGASTVDDMGNFSPGAYVGWMGKCSGSTNLACDTDRGHSKGFVCTNATCSVAGDAFGDVTGQFNNPVYLAIDPNDVLYVADYSNQRVQRFAADGTFAGQAQSVGNGINAENDGAFVLGNMGPPRQVTVNSKQFFVVDQDERFIHVYETSPLKDITHHSATVTYVSEFAFNSDTDVFTYAVNDGLADSNIAQVSVRVNRNYRQPLPVAQSVTTDEDNQVVIVLSGTDPDGIVGRDVFPVDSLAFVIAEQPQHGRLVAGGETAAQLDDGTSVWTYIPDQDFHGTDRFAFTVRDAFTDQTFDGATEIPEPYGEAEPVIVDIEIAPVNDMPILTLTPPDRVAAGFPMFLDASLEDDTGDQHLLRLHWGDGSVDRNGDIVIDDNGTPNDSSDDSVSLQGINYSNESMASVGKSPANAVHVYSDIGERRILMCVKDEGRLESCKTADVLVEQLAVLTVEVSAPDGLVTDGNPFAAGITVRNEIPAGVVAGLDADNVLLKMEVPPELAIDAVFASQGSCNVVDDQLECNLGAIANGDTVGVELIARGKNSLLAEEQITLTGVASTDTPALADEFASSDVLELQANPLDADGDGLSSVFELHYGVSDPAADDDGDGLDNQFEFDNGTSPVSADTDGDGVDDWQEVVVYATDPIEADSDGDGLADGDEIFTHGSDPNNSDTDGDRLPDKWEIDNGFDPALADGDGDADGDGISDADEYELDTDFQLVDSDGDGLSDGDEINIHSTSPKRADTDGDGLDDGAELAAGTNPLRPDTDEDGLEDGAEIATHATDPLNPDSDRDGLPDGWEVFDERDPLRADYQLAAGGLSSCALTDTGVECWGRNNFGQAPTLVAGLENPQQITMGYVHACAIDLEAGGNRTVECWGNNDAVFQQTNVPPLVEPLQVAASGYHTCALDRTAPDTVEVVCWGRDDLDQVSGAPTGLENPVRLVSAISGNSSCVLDDRASGPELICWGWDSSMQVSGAPTDLTGPIGPLALGSEHGCIVDDGDQFCWGLNTDGQAPLGPVSTSAVQLALGGFQSCALVPLDDFKYGVECWGQNDDGEASVPPDLIEPLQIAAGSHHSCTLDQGSAKCWGRNTNGEAPAARVLGIDPDGDGVPTATEIANDTDPFDADTDRDGLDDSIELSLGTDPLLADSDDDGVSDTDEVNVHGSDPNDADSDGDGLPDGWEVTYGLQINVDDAGGDNDGDNLTNRQELAYGTDPTNADTDDDGIADDVEINTLVFLPGAQALGGAESAAVELGDVDGDGDLDAAVANLDSASAIWLNDGNASFDESLENSLSAVAAADVGLSDTDGDDDLDLFLVHPDNAQSNSLWLNGENGDAQGVYSDGGFDFGMASGNAVGFGTLSDLFTGPGFVIANSGTNHAYNFDQGGSIAMFILDNLGADSANLALGDLNGDGLSDAVVVNRDAANQVFLYRPPFTPIAVPPIPDGIPDESLVDVNNFGGVVAGRTAVALGDLDGDDDLDAFVTVSGGGDQVWINNGSGVFSNSGQSLGSDASNDVVLFDVDGDGDLDAAVAANGPNRLWLNTGGGTMVDSGLAMGSADSRGLAVGDLDGDGDLDLLVANDGANAVWEFRQLDPNKPDSDGDGAFDGWELTYGLDPLAPEDGELDSDFDGLDNAGEFDADTDPLVADSDADGMTDGWEVSHGLDPNFDDSLGDIDIDGVNNLAEFEQDLSPQIDDVPPVITVPDDVTVNSTGLLTAAAAGVALASDFKTGNADTSLEDPGPFPPGRNRVTWSARDGYGNYGEATQNIDVIPLLNFSIDQLTAEGATAQALLQLNGSAVTYPVEIDYTVSGVATFPDDHDANDGTVTIDSGISVAIPITIVDDGIPEPDESFTLTLGSLVNAVPGAILDHTLTITGQNIVPTVSIGAVQDGGTVTTIAADAGPVTITATTVDPNPADTHSYDWSGSDVAVIQPINYNDQSFDIDPSTIAAGIYRLEVNIADDGIPPGLNSSSRLIRVIDTAPLLDTGTDSDGDGVSDANEGWGDSDGDGVPDYLDPVNAAGNILLLNSAGHMMETQTGLQLVLGSSAFGAGTGAGVSELAVLEDADYEYPGGLNDFEIHGVAPGGIAEVIIPLGSPIPAGAVYRKQIGGAWQDFVVDGNNAIASAAGEGGACPALGTGSFTPGLTEGHGCLRLTLEDGGPNDADQLANGVIVDPGGIAVVAEIVVEVIPVEDSTVDPGSTDVVILALRLTNNIGDYELLNLVLQASGPGNDRRIKRVRVYVDSNENGVVDGGEPEIASGIYASDDGELTLQMDTPYVLPLGQTSLLVTYDF